MSVERSGRCDQRHGGATRTVVLVLAAMTAAGCSQVRRSAPPRAPTIADRVEQYGRSARARLVPFFTAAHIPYPPARFILLALKRERELQLYAAGPAPGVAFIRSFDILGASGTLGPKLREGDRQVPEGVYRIVYLNPHSVAHLSLAVSYPNAFDRLHAEEDGREAAILGGDIMIHGGEDSVGCLAIGDEAAEDLFILAADADWEQAMILISPVDFRRAALPADDRQSAPWVNQLYAWLRSIISALPSPPPRSRAAAEHDQISSETTRGGAIAPSSGP